MMTLGMKVYDSFRLRCKLFSFSRKSPNTAKAETQISRLLLVLVLKNMPAEHTIPQTTERNRDDSHPPAGTLPNSLTPGKAVFSLVASPPAGFG